jgi:anti-sigma regulatory factor (Ser/Thr protein kinase)
MNPTRRRIPARHPRSPLALLRRGSFAFATLAEAFHLAQVLARLCPDPARVVLGLTELLVNALEHGNLGITYQDKTLLLDAHQWRAEVHRRQQLPENRDKRVRVRVERLPDRVRFLIEDEGPGFDWRAYQEASPDRMLDSHGRGIVMARLESFDRLEYLGAGNRVVAEVRLGG